MIAIAKWYDITYINWDRLTHICVSKLTKIGQENNLPPRLRQAIIYTNAEIWLIRISGSNFSEIRFDSRKYIWNCSLWNDGIIAPASMC